SPISVDGNELPGSLAQAGNVAAHGGLAQHVAAEAELAVDGARTAGQGAAAGLAALGGVARQLLQLHRGVHLLFVARRLAADDLLERLALGGVLLRQLRALHFAVDHRGLCHESCPVSCGTGSGRPRAAPWLLRWCGRTW